MDAGGSDCGFTSAGTRGERGGSVELVYWSWILRAPQWMQGGFTSGREGGV